MFTDWMIINNAKEDLKMTAIEKLKQKRPWILHVDDERSLDNGIIVTLQDGYEFCLDPGCGVRGFDTFSEMRSETRKKDVQIKKSA